MPTVPSTTALELKQAGQQAALDHTYDRDAAIAAVEEIVCALPPRTLVSVNRIRPQLDAAGIPKRARGSLMGAMCARGHLEPVFVSYRGIDVAVTEPSTGITAHRSDVRVYERPGVHPEGR